VFAALSNAKGIPAKGIASCAALQHDATDACPASRKTGAPVGERSAAAAAAATRKGSSRDQGA